MNGYGSPWDWFALLPYQFPLVETFPVVRIPVAGPAPFNTLVVVRTRFSVIGQFGYADGEISRYTVRVGTGFRLIGHDPRVKPAFDHSTTAALQMIQSSDDTEFLVAVDTVTGEFADDGTWLLTVQIADAFNNVLAACNAYASSWVLCYEPPIDPAAHPGAPRQTGTQPQSFVASVVREELRRTDSTRPPRRLEAVEPWLETWGIAAAIPTDAQRPPAHPQDGVLPSDRSTQDTPHHGRCCAPAGHDRCCAGRCSCHQHCSCCHGAGATPHRAGSADST